jgi:hypothetical protein
MESNSVRMRINSTLRSSTTHGRNVTRPVSGVEVEGSRGREQGERRPMEIYTKVAPQAVAATTVPSSTRMRRPTRQGGPNWAPNDGAGSPRTPAEQKLCLEKGQKRVQDVEGMRWRLRGAVCQHGFKSTRGPAADTDLVWGAIPRRWTLGVPHPCFPLPEKGQTRLAAGPLDFLSLPLDGQGGGSLGLGARFPILSHLHPPPFTHQPGLA